MSLAMSKAEREAFLADVHVGIIAIGRANKGPLAVPIWYDYEVGGKPWMMTHGTSIKGKLLAKADRMSLCVQTEVAPYQYVSIEGPFKISEPSASQSLAMAVRYLGEEQGRAYVENSGGGDNILVTIEPEIWYSVDYRKM